MPAPVRADRLTPRAECGGADGGQRVQLAPDIDHRHAGGQPAGRPAISASACAYAGGRASRQVVQEQHRIGAFDLAPGARDADLLDLVGAVAQAGGIDHMQRHALDLDGLRHHVAGGARDRS